MGPSGDNYGAQMRLDEERRQQAIRAGNREIATAFSGFNEPFYDQRQQAYVDYALPQVGEQYRQQRAQLGYTMANRGLSRSRSAQRLFGTLEEEMARQQRAVSDEGASQAQQLRKEVEQNRANISAQLAASGDPALAQQQALASASTFSAPSTFAPAANAFNTWAQIYMANRGNTAANNAVQAYNNVNYQAPLPNVITRGN